MHGPDPREPAAWGTTMRTRPDLMNVLIVAVSASLAFLLTPAVDRAAGFFLYSTHRNAGLIWGPYSTVRHTTPEFAYTARINNLDFATGISAPAGPPGNGRSLSAIPSLTAGEWISTSPGRKCWSAT